MREKRDEIYVGGYAGYSQLDTADSLAGEIGDDALDAGYSPPDYETYSAHDCTTEAEILRGESLAHRLWEEEPEIGEDDLDAEFQDPRSGRLVGEGTRATDVGRAGWAASAEEAAMHIVTLDDDGDRAV